MKAFWKVLKRFAAPYKKYLAGSVVLNLLSAVFNIFSFALLIPILNILFKTDTTVYEFIPWEADLPMIQSRQSTRYGWSCRAARAEDSMLPLLSHMVERETIPICMIRKIWCLSGLLTH